MARKQPSSAGVRDGPDTHLGRIAPAGGLHGCHGDVAARAADAESTSFTPMI
jgi:hypothetical protein